MRGDDDSAWGRSRFLCRGLSRLLRSNNGTVPFRRLRLFLGRFPCRPIVFRLRWLSARGQDGGHQISETLADAGARLDHEMMLPADSLIDGLGHGELLAAVLVVGQPRGNASAGTENFARGEHSLSVPGMGRRGQGKSE